MLVALDEQTCQCGGDLPEGLSHLVAVLRTHQEGAHAVLFCELAMLNESYSSQVLQVICRTQ